jgi:DNA-binding Xre family transcriptional regulator
MGTPARIRLRDTIKKVIASGVSYTDVWESGAISSSNLARVISPEGHNVRLEQLDYLAQALDVEPWQLLHPDFTLATLSEHALRAARKIDCLPADKREAAYALLAYNLDFLAPQGDGPSAPDSGRPIRVRHVHR